MDDFIFRLLGARLRDMAGWFPIVSLSGPRQSGKSTLAKAIFPEYEYVNLENPQTRSAALEDPVSFIRNREPRLIIDEAQYAPDLFSMIQVVSDERKVTGQYVLTGSQNFLMMQNIGQSLAGRVGLLTLLPLSFWELQNASHETLDTDEFTLEGGYPRLHDANIPPEVYFPSYIDTYVERDVAELLEIRDKASFHKLLTICAHNAGGLINIASVARDAGVSAPTIKGWLSILEKSYLVFSLQPFYANMKKRLTKTPKLYFYDTGLLCHLLKITTLQQLVESTYFGAIFENLIVSETLKRHLNAGKQPELSFYRDDSKREIDLLDFTYPDNHQAIEIKSSRTFHDKYAKHLNIVCDELGIDAENRYVVARVESSYQASTCKVVSARDWLMIQGDGRQ